MEGIVVFLHQISIIEHVLPATIGSSLLPEIKDAFVVMSSGDWVRKGHRIKRARFPNY